MAIDNVIAFTPRPSKKIAPIARHTEADRLMSEVSACVSKISENGYATPEEAANDLIQQAMVTLFVSGMSASKIEVTLRAAIGREIASSFFVEALKHEGRRL